MLSINNISVVESDTQKQILKNISFDVEVGKVAYIDGLNGSGKSTLLNAIMGNPSISVKEGEMTFNGNILNHKDPSERSRLGIFLANQTPISIPGLSLKEFLRIIYNIHHEEQLPVFKFRKILEEKAEIINYPQSLLDRNLNVGFSGGERKKTEILQLLIIEPKLILIDEADSGLDKQSRAEIFKALKIYKETKKNTTWLIVSHYNDISDHIFPDLNFKITQGKLTR